MLALHQLFHMHVELLVLVLEVPELQIAYFLHPSPSWIVPWRSGPSSAMLREAASPFGFGGV
jgi:hypothetical protein